MRGESRAKRRESEGETGESDRWAQRREGCWVQHCGRAEHMTALHAVLSVCECVILDIVCLCWFTH